MRKWTKDIERKDCRAANFKRALGGASNMITMPVGNSVGDKPRHMCCNKMGGTGLAAAAFQTLGSSTIAKRKEAS